MRASPSILRSIALPRAALLALAVLLVGALPAAAETERRVALVIGNAAYSAAAVLQNPLNDVALMERTLRAAGFTSVDTLTNADRASMVAKLREFEDKATGAEIAVIYYSGHGMELAGQNYLVPVDARLATDRDIVDEALTLERVQLALDGVKRLRLVILDACRNNPFETTMKRSVSFKAVSRGLSRVEPGANTLVAFAAKAGTVADDGTGTNSPYALSLAARLVEPGVDVQLAFRKVRDDVLEATGQRQEPFVYGSLGGAQLSLVAPTAPASVPLIVDVDQDAVWEAVSAAGDAQLVRDFILKYPRSQHRQAAIELLAALQRPAILPQEPAKVVVPASPPPAVTKEPKKEPQKPVALASPEPLPPPAAPPRKAKAVPGLKPTPSKKKTKVAVEARPVPAAPAAVAPAPQKKSGFFFSCKLPQKNARNSDYYGVGAAVIRCAE